MNNVDAKVNQALEFNKKIDVLIKRVTVCTKSEFASGDFKNKPIF